MDTTFMFIATAVQRITRKENSFKTSEFVFVCIDIQTQARRQEKTVLTFMQVYL